MTLNLIVMVKEPRPGRVKSRLAKGIGKINAKWWYLHQCRRLFRNLADPRWQLHIAVTPDVVGMQSRVWPSGLSRLPQGLGDLGDRMTGLLRSFAPEPTLIVGSDIPEIRRHHIAGAFSQLKDAHSVLGPTLDGGYWLIGARGRPLHPNQLEGVRWSTAHALEDTFACLSDRHVVQTDQLRDVDTVSDLAK